MTAFRAQALDGAGAARFRHAASLLQAGETAKALAIAEHLAAQAPHAADAWQLLGMCLDGSGRHAQAVLAFERALGLAPGNAVVVKNYGLCLARQGRALRTDGQLEAAAPVLRRAVALAPYQVSAWVDLGAVLRMLGHIDEGLVAFRRAEELLRGRGPVPAELRDAINGTLVDAGRLTEALPAARALVAENPGYAPAYETLAHLLWEYGRALAPGEDPLSTFLMAARDRPDNRELQLALARMLVSARRADEALEIVRAQREHEPDDPHLQWFAADALDALGRHDEAFALYERAARSGLADVPAFLNAWARHAFRTRRIELAGECAQRVVRIDPCNQEGWSHLAIVWRLAGDEREHWLCDYERLVGQVWIEPPAGFDDLEAFLAALSTTLEPLHGAGREPVNQSVRGGTQTAGRLFGRNDRVIGAAEESVHAAVERWLAGLPDDPSHPFLSRKGACARFVGSWSVRLQSSGRHANHIHAEGWLSSAFYVALPRSVLAADGGSQAGWIQFGQPLEELRLDLSPRCCIRPAPGRLVLFPSYIWHGTVPFEDSHPRLTIAFDMQPGSPA